MNAHRHICQFTKCRENRHTLEEVQQSFFFYRKLDSSWRCNWTKRCLFHCKQTLSCCFERFVKRVKAGSEVTIKEWQKKKNNMSVKPWSRQKLLLHRKMSICYFRKCCSLTQTNKLAFDKNHRSSFCILHQKPLGFLCFLQLASPSWEASDSNVTEIHI